MPGARNSQTSHTLDTLVRRAWAGPCRPLCTGLPTGISDRQISPWGCPQPWALGLGPPACPQSGQAPRPLQCTFSLGTRGAGRRGPAALTLCVSAQVPARVLGGRGPRLNPCSCLRLIPAQRSPRRRLTFLGRKPLTWLAVIFRQGLFARSPL